MDISLVLQAPVVTEKSTNSVSKHQYLFWVDPQANKIEIARAVEEAYGVEVKKVTVSRVRAKSRVAGRGRLITKRHAGKKATVTIGAKETIDFNKVKTK